ncbi:tripartite tricarboxylate transporter substrate binding protein [Limnohabitans sp.]|jgi:tripartite-type tricarboxylate transporter receptor subunit TctC|uniref:Bug family tripartite tricarboxylate transporter substrate binding protein n=1 Tax=Limnohabitans sp. TaxID=1907725 RepID=UPI00286F3133|nr:tripartite tricarboxylate transporter substrate binding protein [Limnohabitans sp.]
MIFILIKPRYIEGELIRIDSSTQSQKRHHMQDSKLKQMIQSAVLAMLCFSGLIAQGQPVSDWPKKPVRWIIPTSPGAGTDTSARIFAQIANETWKQAVIPDNKPGASGMLGLDALNAATPDGYTLSFMSVSQFIDATLLQKYQFDQTKDFTPITLLASTPLVLLTNSQTGIRSATQLIAYAKEHPNEMNYGSGGSGGLTHIAMEMFANKAGVKFTHIPYKGSGPAVIDLLAGRVQLGYSTPPAVIQHIKSGRLIPLAVTTPQRFSQLPDVPTVAELGFSAASITTWYGLFGPSKMNPALVEKISQSLANESRRNPTTKDRIITGGIDPVFGTPAEFAASLKKEREQILSTAKLIGFEKDK